MERPSKRIEAEGAIETPSSDLEFISTGCTLLDCILGGGWPLGRVFNVVGDSSSGKTLLAIEAGTNFIHKYKKGRFWYRESEAAFDETYARSIGMPIERVSFIDRDKQNFDTIEDFYDDLERCCDKAISIGQPGFYILDSLDALSDEAERNRKINENSYGGNKAKKLSELFRRTARKIEQSRMCVGIISQVRDKIGVSFGRKTTRSGGRALQFYCSQVVYIAHIETLYRTKAGQKRAYAVRVKAKCDKNKIATPYTECEFIIHFGYGIEDLSTSLEWLIQAKRTQEADLTATAAKNLIQSVNSMDIDEYNKYLKPVSRAVRYVWNETEKAMRPKRKKYED